MTKIKNTKKGMAKKTLSMSLVVAMLATSNVPVWAAEFSDGSDASVATEAPVVEDASDAVAFSENSVDAPVVADSDNADVAQAGETKVSFTLKENGWGKAAELDKLDLTGITATDGAVDYQWKVDGKVVAEGSTSIQDIQTNHMYTPDKLDCGKTLQLVLSRDASAEYTSGVDPMKFSFESNVVTISKNNISGCTPTITTKTVDYDGKEHNDANDWITSLSVTAATNHTLTYTNGDFNVTVEGTKGLVNTDSEITLRIQPRDTEYYTGEISVSTVNNGGSTKLGIAKVAYNAADKNITAELANPAVVYNGKDQTPKKEDIVLKDTKSGAVLDSKTVIKNISVSKSGTAVSTAAEAGEYKISVALNNDKTNYSNSGDITISDVDFTIKKVDLSNCTVILNDLKTQNGQITPSQLSVKEIRDKDGNAYTYLNPSAFEVTSVQSNTGAVGNYTATVKAKDNCVNYEGTATATFTVYNQKLDDVNAKFDGKVKVNGVETPYASMAEDYTGAAITKDAAKLGKLMATDKNNKTYELLPNVSYDPNFTYERNTDAGTAVLVVKGIGDYAGSTLRVQFQIKAASVADTDKDVKAAEKVVYVEDDAKKAESYAPELTVIGKNTATPAKEFNLVKDKDYTVEYFYTNNTTDQTETGTNDLGDFVCTKITIKNKNFWGLDTNGVNNTSEPAAIYRYSKISKPQAGTWTVSTEKSSYTYTGEAIIPELIVKDGSKELEKDVDYEIKSIANGTNVGTATVTLAGKGDYDTTSTTTTTFTITPADMSSLTVNIDDQKYTGHQIRPTVTTGGGTTQITAKLGKVNIDLSQFTISYPDSKDANKEVGTGTLTLAPKTTNKNFVGSKEVSFKIVGQTITHSNAIANAFKVYDENGKEVDVANASFIYDGKAHTFASASFNYAYTDPITHKTVKLEEGKDFEIKYFHNVTGDANDKAYIAVVGKGNYAGDNTQTFEDENGKKVNAITYKAFTITPVTLSDQNVSVANGTYAEGMAVKPVVTVSYGRDSLTLKEGKDYELVGAGAYTEPTDTKKYTVSVKGINGYTGQTKQFSWRIDKKDLSSCDVTATKNAAGTVSVVVMNGNVKVPSEKYVVTENTDGTVTVTPTKDSKYYTGSKTITVSGAENQKPGTPMISSVKVTGNKATVILSDEAEGASGYDYVISTSKDPSDKDARIDVVKNQVQTTANFKYVTQGTYYAYCHAWTRDENGKKVFGEWSNSYPFSVTAITPDTPEILSVKTKGSTITVTYKESANSTGYDVVLGKGSKKEHGETRPYQYGKYKKLNVKPGVCKAVFKNIPAGTYYAGVHSWNRTASENDNKVFSKWSNLETAKVK